MRKIFVGVAILAGLCAACAAAGRGREISVARGPDEDGTKSALVKIAGEGMMNSHAFQYLTELSDDVGSRVTGAIVARVVAGHRAGGIVDAHPAAAARGCDGVDGVDGGGRSGGRSRRCKHVRSR